VAVERLVERDEPRTVAGFGFSNGDIHGLAGPVLLQ
jgi:hypothetical protein